MKTTKGPIIIAVQLNAHKDLHNKIMQETIDTM